MAVAPPVSDTMESADAIGPLIEKKLGEATHSRILSYEKTAPTFGYYGSNQGLTERKNEKYNLFYDLKADQVFVSQAVAKDEGYTVSGTLKDVYTGKDVQTYAWDITPAEPGLRDEFTRDRFIGRYFHFLPNTIFFNFAEFDPSVYIDGVHYAGHSSRGPSVTDQLLDYISFLSLAHLDRPRAHVKGHFVFDFVPSFNFSDKRINYDQYGPIENVQFNRLYASGGYGMEFGHLSRIGFFYLDLVPLATWTQLAYSTPSFDEKISHWSVTLMYEVGYSYFVTSHLILKAFVRSLGEDNSVWERAIRDISGQSESVSNVSSVFTGVSIGYYIPSSLKDRGRMENHGSSLISDRTNRSASNHA